MRKTISHLADRLGDAMATLFTLLALLLIPHAVIRAIIGQALHQWTPITWLAIHTALTIAALATSLASYAIAALLAPPRPETYQRPKTSKTGSSSASTRNTPSRTPSTTDSTPTATANTSRGKTSTTTAANHGA